MGLTPNPRKFADILSGALYRIRANEHKKLAVIQDEVGYAIGRNGGGFIQYLRRGHVPGFPEDVLALTMELVRRRGLQYDECKHLLLNSGLTDINGFLAQLFPLATSPVLFEELDCNRPDEVFVVGPPVSRLCQFVGREYELRRLFSWWRTIPMSHALLTGPTRAGKTSLLQCAQQIVSNSASFAQACQQWVGLPIVQGYRCIYVNFHNPRMHRTETLLTHLATGLGIADLFMPLRTLEHFIDLVTHHPWQQPVVLMLDDLHLALQDPTFDYQIWWMLYVLINEAHLQGNLAIVASTIERDLLWQDSIDLRAKPFLNIFCRLELGPLTENEAISLVQRSYLKFPEKDVCWIFEQSRLWPCLLQHLCQERLTWLLAGDLREEWRTAALHRIRHYAHLLT